MKLRLPRLRIARKRQPDAGPPPPPFAELPATPPTPPDAQDFTAAAARCRRLLDETIQPFYLQAATAGAPGYLEDETGGTFHDRGERLVMMQARYLWYFSEAAAHGVDIDANLAAADHGFAFLEGAMRDPVHGGYFALVAPDGEVLDDRKALVNEEFALYALARYARTSGNPAARQSADALFALIEDRARDPEHGGYREHFHRDWTPLETGVNPWHSRLLTSRGINAHMHLLEAYAEYARLAPGELVETRIRDLLDILVERFRHPSGESLLNLRTADWRRQTHHKNQTYSHGHDLELLWFVFDAARLLGIPEKRYLAWADALARNALRCSRDPAEGGFYVGGRHGQAADRTYKEWWAQAEALVAFLELYAVGGDAMYWSVFIETLDLLERRFVAPGGGWWPWIGEDGAILKDTRAWNMQGPYHNGRAMLRCAALLDELAAVGTRSETRPGTGTAAGDISP